MSNKASTWAWDQEISDPLSKFILVKMADIADDNLICFPSFRHIASQCSIHRRTVIRKVDELENLGMVAREAAYRDNGSETSNRYQLKPSAEQLLKSKTETEARRAPKRKALKTALKERPPSDTQSLPSDTRPLGGVVTHDHYPSDTGVTPPSDTGVTPPSDTGVTPITISKNHHFEPSVLINNTATPNQRFANAENHPEFEGAFLVWKKYGNAAKQNDLSDFVRLVSDTNRISEFLLGTQNYLNRKSTEEKPKYKNFGNFIRDGMWQGDTEVLPGPVHIPGAPIPASATAQQPRKRASYLDLLDTPPTADPKIIEGEFTSE